MLGDDTRSVIEGLLERPVDLVVELPGGDGHRLIVVDSEWVFRFARSNAVGARDRIEQRILPLVDKSVPFTVPKFEFSGVHRGLSYVGYRRIAGRSLKPADLPSVVSVHDLATLVSGLHSVDREKARTLLGVSGTSSDWTDRYRRLRARAQSELKGILSPKNVERVDSAFTRFFQAVVDFDPVFVHGDLGSDHILVDDQGAGLVGLIDFESADVGDPAVDFVGFIVTLGPDLCDQIIDEYRGPVDDGFRERVRGYWWIGSLYAIFHGLDTDDDNIVSGGSAGLMNRLSGLERLGVPSRLET